MLGNPLVSVITPTYKRADMVERTIDSVFAQTYKNIEMIVVDDCSPDNTREVMEALCKKYYGLTYIRLPENRGACVARNKALHQARGEYIAFLDDDDVWDKAKISKQIEVLIHNPSIAIITCYEKYGNKIIGPEYDLPSSVLKKRFLRENVILGGGSAAVIPRSIIERVGKWDENLPACQDWDYFYRCARYGDIHICPEVLLYRFVEHERITTSGKYLIYRKSFYIKYRARMSLLDKMRHLGFFLKLRSEQYDSVSIKIIMLFISLLISVDPGLIKMSKVKALFLRLKGARHY